MKRVLGTIASLALGASALVMATPASAADATVNLYGRDGVVGVQQTLDAQVSLGGVGGTGTVTFTANGQVIGTDDVGPTLGYDAQIYWSPATAGRTNLVATFSGGGSDSTSVNVSTVSTQTTITSPGTAAGGSTIALTAQVIAKNSSYVPTGNVTFYMNNGSNLGTANLNGNGVASLNYQVTTSSGRISFYARYNGDNNAKASNNSASTTTQVSATGSSVALTVPQTNYLNTATTLTATIKPGNGTGTVTFTVDGKSVGTGTVANGTTSVTWVPTALGNPKVIATYSGGNGVSASADSKVVAVVQPLKTDTISIDPVGSVGPILNGQTFVLANGASVQTKNSSASGLPVTIAINTPCAFNASTSTFSVMGVGGNCNVTATTPGGNGYAPGKLVFTISTTTGQQTANISAPKSGTYKVGKVLTLAQPGVVTNLNQAIAWKVTAGGSICKVTKDKGATKLKLVKRGKCTVVGSAPAIGTQWSAYKATRNYTVK